MISSIAKALVWLGIRPIEAERFAKFLAVGTFGFVIDFGVLTILVEAFAFPDIISEVTGFERTAGLVAANTISFTMAVISNFTLNRYWTYPESRTKRKRVQLPQFTLVSIVGLALNNGILAATTGPFDVLVGRLSVAPTALKGYIVAKGLATIVVLFWNFFINRYWTYSNVE